MLVHSGLLPASTPSLPQYCVTRVTVGTPMIIIYFVQFSLPLWRDTLMSNWEHWPDQNRPKLTSLPWFGMSWGIDLGTRDFRLDSSRLFDLCKLNLIIHTKCWKGALCKDYEAEFTEVKQARKVKPEVTCTRSWIYVTTLSMSIIWSVAWVEHKKIRFSGF